ncbi:MAG TPA: DegV family protein [Symbiobacteriaceae bacterium]|nr:DegV family protein [Symbiobacteriaceae bacterium]
MEALPPDAGGPAAGAELIRRQCSHKEGFPLNVKIVTDSTASIPAEICRSLHITVVPVVVHFGQETYIDGVNPAAEFYGRLGAAEQPPTTSTPSPGTFLETYRKLAADGAAIISIHLFETKSALINVARMAAKMLPESNIHIIDSQTTTLGLGLLTIAAARAAAMGRAVGEIISYVESLVPHVHIHAAIRDLTQLRLSGRVSLGQAMVAGVLGIKPILYIGQGVADVVDRVRGWSRAVDHVVSMALERAGQARVFLAVVHTNAEAEARQLLDEVRSRFNCIESIIADAGTGVATHAGPGALGIVTLRVDQQ